jgi:ParB/RepB/Spo0J family partition protein
MTEQIQAIETAKCHLHPLNRKRLGDMKAFTADIAENGIEVPLIARHLTTEQTKEQYPDHSNGSQAVQILAGARRLTAADTCHLVTVPVILRDYDDDEAFLFLMRENLHREDVHALDESDYFQQCITASNGLATVEVIAAEIGKEQSYVHKRLRLQELIPAVRKLFEKDEINAAVAMEMARVPDTTQKEVLKRMKSHLKYHQSEPMSAPLVRRWIQHDHLHKLKGTAFNTDVCTECPHRSGSLPSLFEGVEWVATSDSGYGDNKKVYGKQPLQKWQYEQCKKTAEGALRSLCIGPDPHDMGRIGWVKIQKFTRLEKSPQEKAAAARQRRNERVTAHHRRLVFQELRKQPVKASELDLRAIALAFFKRLHNESQKIVCREWEWEPIKQQSYNGWDYRKTCAERLKVMKDTEVRQFLATLPVAHVIHHNYWGSDKDSLMDNAKAAGIDTKKLKTEAEAKFPLKKAKKAKQKKGSKN